MVVGTKQREEATRGCEDLFNMFFIIFILGTFGFMLLFQSHSHPEAMQLHRV